MLLCIQNNKVTGGGGADMILAGYHHDDRQPVSIWGQMNLWITDYDASEGDVIQLTSVDTGRHKITEDDLRITVDADGDTNILVDAAGVKDRIHPLDYQGPINWEFIYY